MEINVVKIKKPVLKMIIELAKEKYPQPQICKLLAEDDVINEISIFSNLRGNIPTIKPLELTMVSALSYGNYLERFAVSPDFTFEPEFIGFAISHTDRSLGPTKEDKKLFSFKGDIHIISARPFDDSSWAAYDRDGNRIEIETID